MKKCANFLKTSKNIFGFNGATTYVYDLNGHLLSTLKDVKAVYRGYVSKDEKILCLKSTDTYLAFYDTKSFQLLKKISLKNCHQPQDAGASFLDDNRFINLQYTDRLVTDIVMYDKNYNEEARYLTSNVVLSYIKVEGSKIVCLGFIRPQQENFNLADLKYYIFSLENDNWVGYELDKKEYYFCACFEHDKNFMPSLSPYLVTLKNQFDLTKEDFENGKPIDALNLWSKASKGKAKVEGLFKKADKN